MMATKPPERIAVQIPVLPWYRDHCFGGKTILPAVEAMRLLAVTVQAAHPELEVKVMAAARFVKFLEIPPTAKELDVLVELEKGKQDGICCRLLSKIQLKTMARMTTHCELHFLPGPAPSSQDAAIPPPRSSGTARAVSAEQVYRELIPFGPAYRTLQDRLFLEKKAAWGTLQAPDLPQSCPSPIGSPFPLDGAMHAACVHGQQLVDFIPFPVGFRQRVVHTLTQTGEHYRTHVQLQSQTGDELVYDLLIFDQAEQVRETVTGLRMRDVTGGRIKPPAWLRRAPAKEECRFAACSVSPRRQ